MGIQLGVVIGPDDTFQDPVGKSEITNVGSMLGPMLGILLRDELGPEDRFEEPVVKSEVSNVGSLVGQSLEYSWGSTWAQKIASKSR